MSNSLFKSRWLEEDVYPHIFAYYFKQWIDYSMNFHTHDSVEIMYVIAGECRIELAGASASASSKTDIRLQLKKSEFIILDGNMPHRLIVDEHSPCRMLNVEFDMRERRTSFPSLRQLSSEDSHVAELAAEPSSYLVLRDSNELYPVLKSLVLELDSREKQSDARTQLLFAQMMVTIAHIRSRALATGANPSDQYVKQSIEYMHHYYDRPIQVKDIAAAVSLHPGYLHRLFSAQTGRTMTAYLTELRMEKAKMLLRETDIPIADICDYVGVGSRQYFHAMFKKYTSHTPIAYRHSIHAQRLDRRSWGDEDGGETIEE